MRRRALRTRDLLVFVLLIALALAWHRRREHLLGLARPHRSYQRYYEAMNAGKGWWSRDIERALHAKWGIHHPSGRWWSCLQCNDILGRDHKRAAEAYEAAAWWPWSNASVEPIVDPVRPIMPAGILPCPSDDRIEPWPAAERTDP